MANEAEVMVTVQLSVTVPAGRMDDIVKIGETLSRAQLGMALEGYTANVMMLTFDPSEEK